MHHSEEEGKVMRDLRSEIERVQREQKLGATGQHPQGRLTPEDEGEIRIAVGVHEGKVVINFGKPVAWIGLDARQARELAESLRQKSYQTDEAKK